MHATPPSLHESLENVSAWPWEIMSGGSHMAPRGQEFPAHAHLAWEWVYYRAGHILYQHGQETFPASPGLLWLMPPRTTHAELARTSYANDYLAVSGPPRADSLPSFCLPHHTLETVAERCGYHSASHLTRQVKKFTGLTPGRLRYQG